MEPLGYIKYIVNNYMEIRIGSAKSNREAFNALMDFFENPKTIKVDNPEPGYILTDLFIY